MIMTVSEIKNTVINAGIKLVENGLIQRTWGNVSMRIDSESFAITPSGRDYLGLSEDDIVIVKINDLSYEGEVKPSSEKGIHAACYALRPEVNFVIHTHQTYASLIGMSGCDINSIEGEAKKVIGDNVPLAAYGLPGTGKLRKGVVEALKRSSSKAVLMHHHGALCTGADLEDAFRVAELLEEVCKNRINERYRELTGSIADSFGEIAEYVSSNLAKVSDIPEFEAYNSVRDHGTIQMTRQTDGTEYCIGTDSGLPVDSESDCPETAALHAKIYASRPEVNAILHSKEPATLAASKIGKTIKPFLDDFAQITGITLRTADYDPASSMKSARKAVKKLKGRDAVLLRNNGALCIGSDADEANAVKLVTEKGCKAFVSADIYGMQKASINTLESALMRIIYKTKYSKKK